MIVPESEEYTDDSAVNVHGYCTIHTAEHPGGMPAEAEGGDSGEAGGGSGSAGSSSGGGSSGPGGPGAGSSGSGGQVKPASPVGERGPGVN